MRALGSGDPDRRAILDALRVALERELQQSVKFEVSTISAASSFAAVQADAVNPNGGHIDYSRTPKYAAYAEETGGYLDLSALLHRENGQWRVSAWTVGASEDFNDACVSQFHAPAEIWDGPSPE